MSKEQEAQWAAERHRCEVRMLLRQAREYGKHTVRDYLDHKDVKGRRDQLRADMNAQWDKGNKGEEGVWL